ncbi:MAG: hypothetical protein ACYC4Q_08770, partial [Victivallaceae bacterium]
MKPLPPEIKKTAGQHQPSGFFYLLVAHNSPQRAQGTQSKAFFTAKIYPPEARHEPREIGSIGFSTLALPPL